MGGGYSQIKAELLLLAKAYSIGGYGYYHLLSGEDLPIKKTKEILDFWDKNNGKEFVAFDKKEFIDHDRVDYYYFFQDKIGRERHYVLRKLDQIGVYLQKRFGLRRNSDIRFQKGANWFSISNSLAGYVLSMEGWIQETFQYTLCCDEVFCRQSLLILHLRTGYTMVVLIMIIERLCVWLTGSADSLTHFGKRISRNWPAAISCLPGNSRQM